MQKGNGMKLSILMVVYNQGKTLETIVKQVISQKLEGILSVELVLIDDGSKDGSTQLIQNLEKQYPKFIKAWYHSKNRGRGVAMIKALEIATGDIGVIQEAHLEYDSKDYSALLSPLIDGEADIVYGSRYLASSKRRVLYFRQTLLNKLVTWFSNWCTDLSLTDVKTCYQAFDLKIIKTIPLRSKRFGIASEIIAKVAKRNLRIYEVSIRGYETYAESKKIHWKNELQTLWTILKYWIVDDSHYQEYQHQAISAEQKNRHFFLWTFDVVQSYFGSRVLSVGSRLGRNIQSLSSVASVMITESDPEYVPMLQNRFNDLSNVEVLLWDITQPAPLLKIKPDTLFCENALAQVEDENQVLQNMHQVLSSNGTLILIVPQGKYLQSNSDVPIKYKRHYTQTSITRIVENNSFRIVHLQTFNKLGVLGRYFQRKIQDPTIGSRKRKFYSWLTPIFRLFDRVLPWKGLSWIVIAKKIPIIINE